MEAPRRSVILIKMHSSSFLESCFSVRSSRVSLLRVFGAPYHGMVSKGLLSIHHRLQIHCIVNVNICIKGPDIKTIASPGRYKYFHNYDKKFMLNFWKRKKGKKINTILQ